MTIAFEGIGARVPRVEDKRLLTGGGRYVDDVTLPGMCHGVVVTSPHAHARVISIDTRAAIRAPGVICILTGADAQADGVMGMPAFAYPKDWGGPDSYKTLWPVLVKDRVRCIGDRIAFVVAETPQQARDAADLVQIEYEPLPANADAALAMAKDTPPVWDDCPDNHCFTLKEGDSAATGAAFANAVHIVKARVRSQRLSANAMEPRSAVGSYDKHEDRYTLYASSQNPHAVRRMLAVFVLGVAESRIRVISPDVGGGFGMKATAVAEQALVLIGAKKFARPVKWIGERIEAFLADGHGRDVKMRGELALDKDARILGLRLSSVANMGGYMSHVAPFIPTVGLRVMGGVYRVPAVYANVKGYFTNTTAITSYRGAGRPEAIYITERLIDAAAAAFNMDRVEIRRRNLIKNEELPYKNWRGLSIDSGDFIANLDEVARRADWAGFAKRRKESESRGLKRGQGVCYYFEASGGPGGPEPSKIKFNDNGTIELVLATQENGQGHRTVFAQILSEKLGVPFDSIIVKQGDTNDGVAGGGTVGSRSLQASGNSIGVTVQKIVTKGKTAAGQVLQAGGAEVGFAVDGEVGRFTVAGTSRSISVTELATTLKRSHVPGFEQGLDDSGTFESPPTFPNGCHICEVEIDPETGIVAIVRYVIVDDVGIVVNPMIVDGQVHGGVAQGLGQALMENIVYDDETGQLMTATFIDYVMPRADDMPDLDISYNEVPCRTNPLGTKGAGEAGTIGALPAIVGAVSDALGIVHIDMPMTPEKIWRALRASAA